MQDFSSQHIRVTGVLVSYVPSVFCRPHGADYVIDYTKMQTLRLDFIRKRLEGVPTYFHRVSEIKDIDEFLRNGIV
jgi:hypothetical protein